MRGAVRLPKSERVARLLTRRRNALLAAVETFVCAGAGADPVPLAQAMAGYVDALPRKRRPAAPAPVDASRILDAATARQLFALR